MADEQGKQLKNVLWSTLRYVDNDGKSTAHPNKIKEYLGAVTDNVDISIVSFQQRIKSIKQSLLEQ